jgi:thiol-disulfide isomerase/thioredoxin
MSRSTMMLVMPLALIVGAIGGAVIASGGSGDVASQVEALTQRVAALEKQLESIKQNLPPSPEQEQAAAQALRGISALMAQGKVEQAKTELDAFMKEHGRTQTAQQAARLADELAVVGKTSPSDWHIAKWFQGEEEIALNGQGTTLVVFWETWCPHCQREVPKLEKVYNDFKGKGLKVIGVTKVNKTATDEKVTEFIQTQKVSYPIAKEDGGLSTYFNVAGIPAAAVVKDGKIVWRGHPANLTDEMLQSWM